jgi:hypothetical protein
MAAVVGSDSLAVKKWMLASTSRVNILLPAFREFKLLSLLEAFLHLRLRPRYEGSRFTSLSIGEVEEASDE